ncbi:MAG: ABC transporter substrate-binding protein [Myxococcales bacterium]|nr:ABC transporter substrate-binding protein [Polyangiaceae bacterium]MDW8249919.1 ABC transporter substrate-binding protein [Myxococcales bacterium]
MRSILRSLLLSASLCLVSVSAFAGPATDVVKAKQAALVDLLKTKGSEKRAAAVFDELLDYDTMARESLGKEWENRSDTEKQEFSDLLKQLVRKSYERNVKKTLNYEIEYIGETSKDARVEVKTRASNKANPREEPLQIDYVLAEVNGQWRIQDIITEGVSLVSSYRSQFTRIIRKDGFPTLLKKMRDKLAKGDVLFTGRRGNRDNTDKTPQYTGQEVRTPGGADRKHFLREGKGCTMDPSILSLVGILAPQGTEPVLQKPVGMPLPEQAPQPTRKYL